MTTHSLCATRSKSGNRTDACVRAHELTHPFPAHRIGAGSGLPRLSCRDCSIGTLLPVFQSIIKLQSPVVIHLPRTLQRHLILRYLSTFDDRRSLCPTIGLRLRGWVCYLTRINRMSTVDCSNHWWSPKQYIGSRPPDFSG